MIRNKYMDCPSWIIHEEHRWHVNGEEWRCPGRRTNQVEKLREIEQSGYDDGLALKPMRSFFDEGNEHFYKLGYHKGIEENHKKHTISTNTARRLMGFGEPAPEDRFRSADELRALLHGDITTLPEPEGIRALFEGSMGPRTTAVIRNTSTKEEPMADNDAVTHPSHYTFSKFEVMHVLHAWQLPYPLDHVVKYLARAGKKDPTKELEDLQKGRFYLNYRISELGGPDWEPKGDGREIEPNYIYINETEDQQAWSEFLMEYQKIRPNTNTLNDDLYEAFMAGRASKAEDIEDEKKDAAEEEPGDIAVGYVKGAPTVGFKPHQEGTCPIRGCNGPAALPHNFH